MTLTIERASTNDIDDVLRLMKGLQRDDPWSEPFVEENVRASLRELTQNPGCGLLFVARDTGRATAYLALCFDYSLEYGGKGAWVDELFVAETHRGKGIATQLMDVAEKAAAEHGAKYLHLEVSHGNPAIELYRRRGFVDHQRYLMTKRIAE